MADQAPPSGPPQGVNMPKKRDPRLRGMQQPRQQQFFDSADYEVRKQQQQQANAHRTGAPAPNPIVRGSQTHGVAGGAAGAPTAPARASPDQAESMPQRRHVVPPPPPSAD